MSYRYLAYALVTAVVGGVVIGAGCSFKSELSGVECSDAGATRDGKVCQNGYWVSNDVCSPTPEKCNGEDDDCDGLIDEGAGCSCTYRGKTTGVCPGGGPILEDGSCKKPPRWTRDEGNTGGCTDMLDNDCDGRVNENCSCEGPGTTRPCYGGPSGTEGVGQCSAGVQRCTSKGTWGECANDVTPRAEEGARCGNAADDDCDGDIDEGCPCDVNGSAPGGREGICKSVTRTENGRCPEPEGYVEPTDDESAKGLCNGLDDDCDGAVDEGCSCVYDPTEEGSVDTDGSHTSGVCLDETRGPVGSCTRPSGFESRTADETNSSDGIDNDCDGVTDEGGSCSSEGDTRDCYSGPPGTAGVGNCTKGEQTCTLSSGQTTWGASCVGEQPPKPEQCDDTDWNCNGPVDDGCPCDYKGRTRGVCAGQTITTSGICKKPDAYVPEEDGTPDCDGKDNDCDGTTDEGCHCTYDPGQTEGYDTDSSHASGVCEEAVIQDDGTCGEPSDFIPQDKKEDDKWCDGKDNDCDGQTDEDGCNCVNGNTMSCYTGADPSKPPTGICKMGTETCRNGEWKDCKGDQTPKSSEDCNDKDDDCDGVTDEGCPCKFMGNDQGVCQGQTIDPQGNCTRPMHYEPSEQTCTGSVSRDNDCDGKTDFEDYDCKRPPGASCNDSEQCRGQCTQYANASGKVCSHRIFATSKTWTGDLNGYSGAKRKCNRLAKKADIPGTWKPIVSTSQVTARTNIAIKGRIYNVDGDKLADGKSSLWSGKLDDKVEKDEYGNDQKTFIWTGTETNGDWDGKNESQPKGDECSDWTSSSGSETGEVGNSDKSNSEWIINAASGGDGGNRPCDKKAALYCIDGQ